MSVLTPPLQTHAPAGYQRGDGGSCDITYCDGEPEERPHHGAVDHAEDADVELDEVECFYTEHGMWNSAFG